MTEPEQVEPLHAMLPRVAARHGNRPAITVGGTTVSYSDLDDLANRGANMLAGLGCGAGDVVMALSGNSLAMIATWLGTIKLGGVFMPVNALLTGAPLREVMAHAAGRVAVVEHRLLPTLLAVRDGLPELSEVVVAGGPAGQGLPAFEALLEGASCAPPPAPSDDPAAPARLMYTSGTTGRPKGALWSRTAEAWHARCYGDELVQIAEGEAVYSCLPLFHATCQGTTLGTLWRGGHIHIDPAFDAFRFWTRVRETGAVFFPYVGTILSVLASRPRQPSDGDNPVRRVMGSAAPAGRWIEIQDRFELSIDDVWGQTELASCWTLPHTSPQRPGTVGRPAERFEAQLVDADGEPIVGEGRGEIWIRPLLDHVIFEGYYRDEGGTAGAWTADGWYRSGDLMTRDAEGDFVFSGRLRDAIRRRGEMITPSAIEEAALTHRAVAEVAAVGVPAPHGVEEEVKLCVVAQPDVDLDVEDLHAALRTALPTFMVPRYIQVYDQFPKTPTTRIRKFQLQADGVGACWDSRAGAAETRLGRAPEE